MAFRSTLYSIFVRDELDLKSQLLEQSLESFIQGLTFFSGVAQPEQKPQIDLIMIWVQSILVKYRLVRGEDSAKRKSANVGVLLSGLDNLVQDCDICTLN